ncbi:MAG: prolyl-tRNA synthetase associated domain-containing protein [Acidobacteria bacterium]|nr:prolyl-tRNA synthetase associated domain-containing protein [Acidobacteriota bacterium]
MSDAEQQVHEALTKLGIGFERYEHPPVATVEEALPHWAHIDATHCKNLFLRNNKGTHHYLVILDHRKQADLRKLTRLVDEDRLGFASPERLLKYLGLTPGSVSPFGLIHDRAHEVRIILDADLRHAAHLTFHPNVNTASLRISRADFERFLGWCGNAVRTVRM